jgi:hypothetical protein
MQAPTEGEMAKDAKDVRRFKRLGNWLIAEAIFIVLLIYVSSHYG